MYHILGVEEDESLQEVVEPLQNLRGLHMAERERRRKGLRTGGKDKKPENLYTKHNDFIITND